MQTVIIYAISLALGVGVCYAFYRIGEWCEARDRQEEARREAARPPKPNAPPPSQYLHANDAQWRQVRADIAAWRAAHPHQALTLLPGATVWIGDCPVKDEANEHPG